MIAKKWENILKYPAGLLEKKKKFVWDDGEGHESQGCDSVVSDWQELKKVHQISLYTVYIFLKNAK